MNADRLLALYEKVAEAPDAVPRLRRFVLDLAVRGKLVPQDANDEPASVLERQLKEQYSQPETSGRGRGRRGKPGVGIIAEPPFELPANWVWARMGALGSTNIGLTYSPADIDDRGYPVLRSNNVQDGRIDLSGLVRVQTEPKPSVMVGSGDMLICARNGSRALVGKAAIIEDLPEPMAFGAFMAIFRSPINQYLHIFLSSPVFREVIDEVNTNTINQITQANLRSTLVPLPPLGEQRRIVTKVEELMALLDRLEAARTAREATRDRLTAASLARLTAPDADAADFTANARFALATLPALTIRPDQIKPLRQTILNLAVRGKLVAQDPTDEPASELLNAITSTRKRIYSEKKIPKPKALPSIDEMDLPFDVPAGWAWSMLGQLCYQVADGPHFSPQYVPPERGVPFLSTRNVRPDGFDLSSMKYVSQADHEEFCKRIKPEPNDIIYTKGGTTGIAKINDLDFEFSVWVHLAVLRIEKERLFPRYIELALNSPHCYAQSQEYTRGISNFDLGLTRMIKITIPLPPLAEQHRIVAKVDALMALCDRLEAALTTADTTRARLLEALLHEALDPTAEAVTEAAE